VIAGIGCVIYYSKYQTAAERNDFLMLENIKLQNELDTITEKLNNAIAEKRQAAIPIIKTEKNFQHSLQPAEDFSSNT
jgi:hypothetical protein